MYRNIFLRNSTKNLLVLTLSFLMSSTNAMADGGGALISCNDKFQCQEEGALDLDILLSANPEHPVILKENIGKLETGAYSIAKLQDQNNSIFITNGTNHYIYASNPTTAIKNNSQDKKKFFDNLIARHEQIINQSSRALVISKALAIIPGENVRDHEISSSQAKIKENIDSKEISNQTQRYLQASKEHQYIVTEINNADKNSSKALVMAPSKALAIIPGENVRDHEISSSQAKIKGNIYSNDKNPLNSTIANPTDKINDNTPVVIVTESHAISTNLKNLITDDSRATEPNPSIIKKESNSVSKAIKKQAHQHHKNIKNAKKVTSDRRLKNDEMYQVEKQVTESIGYMHMYNDALSR